MLLDAQEVYPQHLIPKVLRDASEWYIAFSGDPLVRGAFNKDPAFDWFRAFLYLEVYAKWSLAIVTKANNPVPRFFQLPVFILAARALYAGPPKSQAYYPIMLAYSASSCTTTFGCLATLWTSPDPTPFQMSLLLGSYVPFFLVPLGMAIDMTLRLMKAQGTKALKAE